MGYLVIVLDAVFEYKKNEAFLPYCSEVSLKLTPNDPNSLTHMLLFRLVLLPCNGFLFFLIEIFKRWYLKNLKEDI